MPQTITNNRHIENIKVYMEQIMRLKFLCGFLCMLALSFSALSQSKAQTVEIRKLKFTPVIDGKADDICWKNVKWNSDFKVFSRPDKKAPVQTRYKIAHDRYYIYFITECFEPKVAKMKPKYGREWNGESLKLYIATSLHPEKYFIIQTNPSAKTYKEAYQGDGTGLDIFVEVPLWNIPIRSASTRNKKSWTVEMAIPLAGFDLNEKTGNEWRINVTRRRFISRRAEDSTYTALKGPDLSVPSKFSKAVMKQFDASHFSFKLREPEIRVTKRDGKLYCSVKTLVDNLTKRSAVVAGQIVLTSDGSTVKSKIVKKKLRAKKGRKMNIYFPLKKQGKYILMFELFSQKYGKKPLKYLFREVKLEYKPIKLTLLKPAYRNNIYATQNLKNIVAEISIDNKLKSIPVVVELSGPDNYFISKSIDLNKTNRVKLNASELKNGKYVLTAKFTSGKMKGVASIVNIRKLSRMKGEVWLDADNITYVDGEKFIPFGWYDTILERKIAGKIALTQRQFKSIKHAKQILDQAYDNNVKMIIVPNQEYHKSWKKTEFNVKTGKCKGRMTRKQKELIRKFVNNVKDHPALFGWYLVDEPEIYNTSSSWYEDLFKLLQKIDPYHPTIITNCKERAIREYGDACDILMPDYYPNYITGRKPLYPFYFISSRVKLAAKYRAAWFVPQSFCSVANSRPELNPRSPTFTEFRSQIYQVFANDGKGILMWSFTALSQLYYPLRMGPEYLDAELTAIKDEILAPNIENGVSIATTPEVKYFQVALKKSINDYCLVAVNTSRKAVEVRFNLKPEGITQMYEMGMNRTVDIDGGSFTDTFSAYETKIFLTSEEKARKTNLPEFLNKLKAAEKSRFKPGNIVAVGAKTMKELKDLQKRDINKAPIFTASSINRAYFYYVWGGNPFYCLADGITDLNSGQMGWRPKTNDVKPWVSIQFPKTTIDKIRLYTYKEKDKAPVLENCKVYILKNGKWVLVGEVKGNVKKVINISFTPVKTTKIKVVIGKDKGIIDSSKFSNHYKAYTLSEIEVYKHSVNKESLNP